MSATIEKVWKSVETVRQWLTEKLEPHIKQINVRLDGMEQRFITLEKRFGGLETKQDEMGQRLVDVERDLAVVNGRLDGLDKRLDDMNANLNARFDEMNASVNARFDDMNGRLSDITELQRELIRYLLEGRDGRGPSAR